ncbi:TlpA family protein disulfide reductase [Microbacterium marinilacus]|nr:TlpA family protein disulfide reductase [Microbacterium marinilacus]
MISVLAVALAGCSADPVTQQYLEGGNSGYIAGEYAVDEIAPAERDEPVVWSGTTEDGEPLSSEDVAGKVVVVNFWYAECGPCIVEAPDLEAVWQDFQGEDVQFVGVNISNGAETARAFARDNGVTYPSLIDAQDATVKLAFASVTSVSATPTTLVLDREGRVAARILGPIKGASILSTLVKDMLEETS